MQIYIKQKKSRHVFLIQQHFDVPFSIKMIFCLSSDYFKPRRRPRTYYQRRRERVRKQAEREAERLELEAMQIHHDLSDSDSSDEEDFECFDEDEEEEIDETEF